MTEIDKMFENAGVDLVADVKFPTKDVNYNVGYPPFTTEKQLEICKFLLKAQHSISYYFYENRYGFVIDDRQGDCIEAEKFEIALAMIVNNLWQDLTDQEREEIRRILNE